MKGFTLAAPLIWGNVLLDPAVFDNFCTEPTKIREEDVVLDTAAMTCARLMEFLYLARKRLADEVVAIVGNSTADSAAEDASRVSSLIGAHVHMAAALASQRGECFSEKVRLFFLMSLRRIKALYQDHVHAMWKMYANGDVGPTQINLENAREFLLDDVLAFEESLRGWIPPTPRDRLYFTHEHDGCYSTLEFLRKETFDEWTIDLSLLKALLPLVVHSEVADFGAGSGQYSTWLNNTGLVTSTAYDGSPNVAHITQGRVHEVNVAHPMNITRVFDYVLFLDVGQYIPEKLIPGVFQNINKYAKKGVILSWAQPHDTSAAIRATPLNETGLIALLREHLPEFRVHNNNTQALRSAAEIPSFQASVLFLTRTSS